MVWQVPVLFGLAMMAVNPILMKRATGLPSRTRRIVWMFGFAMCLTLTFAYATGATFVGPACLTIAAIGFANSWGAYCQWRAVDISVSRTYLFTQADDLIAMALGWVMLREYEILSGSAILATGVTIAVATGVAIAVTRYRSAHTAESPDAADLRWARLACWIAGYSVIWGIANFAMRYFALRGVGVASFLAAWYVGSFIGALSIRFLLGAREAGSPLDGRGVRGMFLLACTVVAQLLGWVWAQQLAPITVVQPIKQVAEMVIPTIIGLTVFKEGTGLGVGGYVRFAIGLAGCAVILVVF